jgi:hypothetical protein
MLDWSVLESLVIYVSIGGGPTPYI